MAVDLSELLALPDDERLRLAEALIESTVPADIAPLLRELVTRLAHTNQALDELHKRFGRLSATLENNRTQAREAVLRSGAVWPPPLSSR